MSKLSKTEKIVKFLEEHQDKKFTTREIVENLLVLYPEYFSEKRKKYKDEKTFINQLCAESSYAHLHAFHNVIKYEKDPELKKTVYWYQKEEHENPSVKSKLKDNYSEYELYPKLIQYLHQELDLYCLRIDEKTSTNINGKGANKWLHPDIVAMKALDQDWDSSVKDCMKQSSSQNVKLFSFEVKKELNTSNLRESFFQTVSNSSWANEGYLVASTIAKSCYEELRVLSSLHGIGVILLNPNQIEESKTIFPAKHKFDVDWQSANRIVNVNAHFKEYIDYVSVYYRTGKIFEKNWNK